MNSNVGICEKIDLLENALNPILSCPRIEPRLKINLGGVSVTR